jgi:hypothetical protein
MYAAIAAAVYLKEGTAKPIRTRDGKINIK